MSWAMMKKVVLLLLVIFLQSACLSLHQAQTLGSDSTSNPRRMVFPPQPFQPPKAERMTLSNGMVLYLLEDHELPLINLQIMIRTGDLYEPADKIALAGMTGSLMRTGGTRNHRGDEVDEILDQIAAGLSVGIGTDSGGASLDVLKKDFDFGLQLLADILMHPAFEEEKLTLAKNRALEGIRRRNDRASSIASREFWKQLYGADNPYARESTEETVNAIQRKDLIAFHQKYFAPNNMMIGVTGDFNKREIIGKIEKAFEGWEKKEISFPKVPPVVKRKTGGVYHIQRPIPQTQVRIGHLGIKQENPDSFALSVMNDVLGGGGMASRLFSDVRSRQGLAYSVGSVFRPGKLEQGVFLAYSGTRVESTHQAISTIIQHIEKVRKEPVLDEELKRAKEAFLNSFIFSFSSPSQIVGQQMSLEYYGLPSDYLEQYRDNVAKVTKADVLRVAREYLHPDRLVILAVGDETQFDQALSTLGKVERIQVGP